MPRRKITSRTKKKEEQKQKRAVKRGDAEPPPPKPQRGRGRGPSGRPGPAASVAQSVNPEYRLQSAFVKLPPAFIQRTKVLADRIPLPRPLPSQASIFNPDTLLGSTEEPHLPLSCPKRPKWHFEMSKKEVEANELGTFTKWLKETDERIQTWQEADPTQKPANENDPDLIEEETSMPRSTSYYERNIEVWRQLWRVTEISQIILVLLDSRCPILHYPPSLAAYLSKHRVILVLTKVDISGPERAEAWERYLHSLYPDLPIVQVESYTQKSEGWGHQGKRMYEPNMPESFRERLVQTIRKVHEEMLKPPERVLQNDAKLKSWKPEVKMEIDWEAVMSAKGDQVGSAVGGAAAPLPKSSKSDDGENEIDEGFNKQAEPEFLTIGLIGQPNVGKSSLLNALFGVHKVKASKTPGKTKHFQTLFWTPQVRLVDCPGLVMPNYVPMELQVLTGILPIARVSAVPSCVYNASTVLPLERIYALSHPRVSEAQVEDKRTWRDEAQRQRALAKEEIYWTAMDVLTSYAEKKGWITAKAGRPDINRAGNAILRSLAEGKIGWAFWPPETDVKDFSDAPAGNGIWTTFDNDEEEDRGNRSSEEDRSDEDPGFIQSSSEEGDEDSEGEEDEHDSEEDQAVFATSGRFKALAAVMDNNDEEDNSDNGED